MELFEKALVFAMNAHHGQTRKNSRIPYILHPCEAASIAATLTDDPEILAAVMLHDTVEDTPATIEEIRENFGERVAYLVDGETEPALDHLSRSESWSIRKEASLDHLNTASDPGVKIMWLSDKLSNMRSFYRLYRDYGDDMWKQFNQSDKKVQEHYYRRVAEALEEYRETPAYFEYNILMDIIFGGKYGK